MNIVELMSADDYAGTSFKRPAVYQAYREMTVPAGPGWVEEHLRRLQASGIQPHFQLATVAQLETVERLIRRGAYTGPLNITWVGIGGGFDGPNPYNMMEFMRRVPDGATLTLETIMRNVLPVNTMAIAMGLHARCGIEDTLWGQKGQRMTSVQQIEQLVRIARELGRDVASAKKRARSIESARATQRLRRRWRVPATCRTANPDSVAARCSRLVQSPSSPGLRLQRRMAFAGSTHVQPPPQSACPTRSASAVRGARAFAWVVFALTLALLLSDYMSRQVLNAVFPLLKVEWHLSDTQLGSLSGIVALMVGVLTFPLSLLADRWGRINSLAVMALLWSLATFACGLAQSYRQMFAARFFVGVGEAAYGSVGIAVILGIFPPVCARR